MIPDFTLHLCDNFCICQIQSWHLYVSSGFSMKFYWFWDLKDSIFYGASSNRTPSATRAFPFAGVSGFFLTFRSNPVLWSSNVIKYKLGAAPVVFLPSAPSDWRFSVIPTALSTLQLGLWKCWKWKLPQNKHLNLRYLREGRSQASHNRPLKYSTCQPQPLRFESESPPFCRSLV